MRSPLRVTFVVPDLGVGGAERHVVDLLARLDRGRVEPRVVCLGEPGRLFGEAARHAPATSYGHSKRQAPRSVLRLARELRRTRAEVVVARGYSAETVGRLASLLARVPHRVVWVHNCDDTEPRGRLRALVDRGLDPVTDAYFGVARRQVPYLTDTLGHPPEKVRIIHNGVDVDRFGRAEHRDARRATRSALGFDDDDVVIGILAALRPEKNHELFLEAAAQLLRSAPTARFLVVGDGPRRAGLEALAEELGLAGRVRFAGFRDDVGRVLAALDVSVLTSATVECFPISLLEAMAAGLPAVCTDVGGVGEILDDGRTGFLVPSGEVVPLAERIAHLVADPERRGVFGEAARARVAGRFTLDRAVGEAEDRLLEVAGSGRTTAGAAPIGLTVVMDTTAVGGAELMTLRMFEAMDRDVVAPRLVCLRDEGVLAADFRAAGVPVVALGRSGRFDLRTLPRLVASLRRTGTDAVLVAHHHRAALVLARVAARAAGVRVTLLAAHDMDLVPLGGRVLPRSTVATLRWTSALVLLARSQGRYLHRHEGVGRHRWSRTREVVVANGIELPPAPTAPERAAARAALGLPPEAVVVGVVARLSAQKAHEVLFAAFARLAVRRPEARLVVVGGGERDAELRRLAVDLGIAGITTFTGVRRDVATLLPGFDVACLSSRHEAAPLTVIEAMAAGLPVVATDCGALREMVDHGSEGLVVAVGDVDALAGALDRLVADRSTRDAMGAAARRRAEARHDVAHTAEGYTELLRGLVRERGRRAGGPR